MPIPREEVVQSDASRDAQRYYRLLTTLRAATQQIRDLERGSPDIDQILGRLLPDLAGALNAQQAFAAILRLGSEGERWFEVTAAYPRDDLRGQYIALNTWLSEVVDKGRPFSCVSLEDSAQEPVKGLELFGARSTIVVRMQGARGDTRIVGICDERDRSFGPFLASDREALDNIVELVAIGARVGERHSLELESIQETSTAMSAVLDLDKLLPLIALKATEVFHAPASSLMLWDNKRENLVIEKGHGLSPGYMSALRIPRARVESKQKADGSYHPAVIDLRREPLADPELVSQEGLCQVLSAPLTINGELRGVLNSYCKEPAGEPPRVFTRYEMDLIKIFANHAAVAIENARLHREEIRRQRLERDIALGEQIQLSILPNDCPQVPGWQFAAVYRAARVVGGDFYDFYTLPRLSGRSARLGMVVADVCDKGVPAALFMVLSRTIIRDTARRRQGPASVLRRANELILQDNQTGMFLSTVYAVLESDTGRVIYANAGHDQPLWYRSAEEEITELDARGVILGLFEDISVEEGCFDLTPGDCLVFYTDGVTEALDAEGKMFGMDRLKDLVKASGHYSAQDLLREILDALDDFCGDREQADDITCFVVKRLQAD
jgi:serine phosphatase RsbU (regulator of sigma subunit)